MPSFPLSSLGWATATLISAALPVGPTAPARAEEQRTNVSAVPQAIELLQVRDPAPTGGPLLSLDNLLLPGATGTTVLVITAFGSTADLPQRLVHRLVVRNADGNSVVLDLGGGRFALYAHFQPGSLRVGLGDRVRRGQVLALVGSTGNSDAPHLHVHVMDGPSPLASNGLAYVINRFEVTGLAVPGPALRVKTLPADLQLVRFLP